MPETTTTVTPAAFATRVVVVTLEVTPRVQFVELDGELAHIDAAATSRGDLTVLTDGLSTGLHNEEDRILLRRPRHIEDYKGGRMDSKMNVSIWASSWLLVFMAISDDLHSVVEVRISPKEWQDS
jgi:hypothetical protein